MTSTFVLRQITLASLCVFTAGAALAQSDNYPYFGLSVGKSRARLGPVNTKDASANVSIRAQSKAHGAA